VQSISCQGDESRPVRRAIGAAAALTAFVATLTLAAEPRVPYVPTPQEVVERMLEAARIGPNDYLIDLGSGDGRIVVTAAKKYGTRGFGVDLNPERIRESNDNARAAGVTDKVAFYQRNLFETDLSQATVITMYLLPRVNVELRPKLLELAPGTRLVSHDFDMADWKPDAEYTVDAKDKYGGAGGKSEVYFWVVPAKVAGAWQWRSTVAGNPQSYEARLEQKFQSVNGSVRVGGRTASLRNVRLRGPDIQFQFTVDLNGVPVRHEFSGKVAGDSIDGTVSLSGARLQSKQDWSARRAARSAMSPASPSVSPFVSVLN
jgi:hypothetical protein